MVLYEILRGKIFGEIDFFSIYEGVKMNQKKSCSNAQGEQGRCMFVWECIKNDGKHLGTCTDGFLYGSCCGKPEKGIDFEACQMEK